MKDCIFNNLDLVEAEIIRHQRAIEDLEALYVSLVHTLRSPFISEEDLSQIQLKTEPKSPEAMPPAERGTDA